MAGPATSWVTPRAPASGHWLASFVHVHDSSGSGRVDDICDGVDDDIATTQVRLLMAAVARAVWNCGSSDSERHGGDDAELHGRLLEMEED